MSTFLNGVLIAGAPATHEGTHVSGGSDDIDSALPLAAIPDTLTGKDADTLDGEEASAFAKLTVAETEVFSDTSPTAWTDLDLSGVVGANYALVKIKWLPGSDNQRMASFRKNGDTDEFYESTGQYISGCVALYNYIVGVHIVAIIETDNAGKIEWKTDNAVANTTIDIMSFLKGG